MNNKKLLMCNRRDEIDVQTMYS